MRAGQPHSGGWRRTRMPSHGQTPGTFRCCSPMRPSTTAAPRRQCSESGQRTIKPSSSHLETVSIPSTTHGSSPHEHKPSIVIAQLLGPSGPVSSNDTVYLVLRSDLPARHRIKVAQAGSYTFECVEVCALPGPPKPQRRSHRTVRWSPYGQRQSFLAHGSPRSRSGVETDPAPGPSAADAGW